MSHLISLLVLLMGLSAEARLKPAEPYRSGRALCPTGERVTVPFDWNNPEGPTTTLHYALLGGSYRSEVPTVAFVNGGPGGTPDGAFDTLEPLTSHFNVVVFHQRGVKCSRPDTAAEIDDPRYYSSRNTALDLERIRETLGVRRWTVWGHSYGTVPATIYGHLFPERVVMLVLEGVVVRGDLDNWQNPHRRKLLERWLKSAPKKLRDDVIRWSQHPRVAATWFAQMSLPYMYYAAPFQLIERNLEELFNNTDEWILRVLEEWSKPFANYSDDPEFGQFAWIHLVCGEFSGSDPKATQLFSINSEGRFLPFGGQNELLPECGARNVATQRHYDSADHPLQVPVTYFNGILDGATPAPNAVDHYQNTARSRAQLLLVDDAGHVSVADLLQSGKFQPYLEKVLRGETLTDADLSDWNRTSSRKIRWTRKN